MGLGSFAIEAWRVLGAEPSSLERVSAPDPPVALPSRLDVAGLVTDSIGVSALAIEAAAAVRDERPIGQIRLCGSRITTSAQSERHFRREGQPPQAWAPLSGFWGTGDGWVRTHANYPHHERRLRQLLGLDDHADREAFASALAECSAVELEDAAAACGAIVVAVRDSAGWQQHPQARVLARTPLISHIVADGAAPRGWPTTTGLPLSGIRVLDLTRVIAGPVATRDLAYAGADVLRVDSPRLPEISWQHLDTGQGKRSTTLDLEVAADRATLDELLGQADAVVTGYRPGALERYGLGPSQLAERYPGVVIGTVNAWGSTGPWRHRRGFDSVVQAATGIAMREAGEDGRPGALPAQALDHSAGHFLAAALTHSLCRQRVDGGTAHVEVALARLAHELLTASTEPIIYGDVPPTPPTIHTVNRPAGSLCFAAPAVTYPRAPETYPFAGTPWGGDPARWLTTP